MSSLRVIVTGVNGFVGYALANSIIRDGHSVIGVSRTPFNKIENQASFQSYTLDNFGEDERWNKLLDDADVVLHCAWPSSGKNHSIDEFTELVDKLGQFAKKASYFGVKRFIFLSSIQASFSRFNRIEICPNLRTISSENIYALSKLEAEKKLKNVSMSTSMNTIIIRPPLIYGAGVKGLFRLLIKLISWRVPFPVCALQSNRSYLAIDNLLSFTRSVLNAKDGSLSEFESFEIADIKPVSTLSLLQKLAKVCDVRLRLFQIPESWVKFILRVIGKKELCEKLFSNLELDNKKAKILLDWTPETSFDEQLNKIGCLKRKGDG